MIKTIFMGTPEFSVPILKTLIEETSVITVITKPDYYIGRKKVLTPCPVKKEAIYNNIPVLSPTKLKEIENEIKELEPDLIVTCAYGLILPESILSIPRLGCINIHASILPKYRGGAPIHHAIINGESETGITIMYMDKGMDTGDIISISKIPIEDSDNVETLHNKLSILGSNLLKETLPSIINKTNNRIKQDDKASSYAPVIKREDEHLNFNTNAINIFNKVRGLNSWPLANMIINDEEIKVIEGYIGENTKEQPSKIVKITTKEIGVSCLDKIYYITKIKPFGKKEMSVKDYLNGIKKEELLNKEVK